MANKPSKKKFRNLEAILSGFKFIRDTHGACPGIEYTQSGKCYCSVGEKIDCPYQNKLEEISGLSREEMYFKVKNYYKCNYIEKCKRGKKYDRRN